VQTARRPTARPKRYWGYLDFQTTWKLEPSDEMADGTASSTLEALIMVIFCDLVPKAPIAPEIPFLPESVA